MSKPILLNEHEKVTNQEDRARLDSLGLEGFSNEPDALGNLHYLGLSEDYYAGYYIGACNLKDDTSLVILPKIDKLGYLQMLRTAFRTSKATDYFASHYRILFDEPLIECGINDDYLTPLLIVSFVNSVNRISAKGLKRGYVMHEENLKGKVRGKICINANQNFNVKRGRLERFFCRYQVYSVDIPENRLLKKALDFSQRYISSIDSYVLAGLSNAIARLQTCFSDVSNAVSAFEVGKEKLNCIFHEYNTAIDLAKLILKRFDFSLNKYSEVIRKVPAYWIDMPALYEVYVYSLLDEAYPGQIIFQAVGAHSTRADFIKKDDGIILDAKYKLRYQDSNNNIVTDIRELSGYARDERLLGLMGHFCDDYVPPCVLIYPGCGKEFDFDSNLDICSQLTDGNRIRGYRKFFKLGVELPNLN